MRRIGVVTFPGSNCDADFRHAIDRVEGLRSVALWHKDTDLSGVDAVVLPGGFSYGDYLRCGAIARFSPMMRSVVRFAAAGRPVLGVCNGFQILCEAGLVPGVLLRNRDLSFLCMDVDLRVERVDTPWTRHLPNAITLPIAHGEGNWFADDELLARVEGEGQVVLRYVDNPNGARNDVAGVCNATRNVVGLMPHPERAAEDVLGGTDGLGFLTSINEVLG